jgi:hypothetical protein
VKGLTTRAKEKTRYADQEDERTNDRLRMGIENELFQKDRSDEVASLERRKKLTIKAMMANADSLIGEIMIKNTRIMGL